MVRTFCLALFCRSIMVLCHSLMENSGQAQETVRIAPASGGVEVNELRISRRAVLGAAKEADLTYMVLGLWFTADWKTDRHGAVPLIHLQELDAVDDDTGRLLSTDSRLKQIQCLGGEVREQMWQSLKGQQGPVTTFVLEAPGRGANKIKTLKGRARVTLARPVDLTFPDLAAVNGKVLEHADLKGLAAMKFRFAIEEKDGNVLAKLSAPVNYASPWNRGRLYDWDLMDGDKDVRLASESVSGAGAGVTVEKTYRRRTTKGLSLRLVVLEEVESKEFSFHFQNVELP